MSVSSILRNMSLLTGPAGLGDPGSSATFHNKSVRVIGSLLTSVTI
jgi:hypothetical protein